MLRSISITSRPKASRGQRYPCPAISCGAKTRCRQGSGPNRGRCPVEHRGEIPSVHQYIRLYVCPHVLPLGWLRLSRGWLRLPNGWMNRQTDRWTDGRTEFPPRVLQDIVPYQVRCPKRRTGLSCFYHELIALKLFLSPGNFKDKIF